MTRKARRPEDRQKRKFAGTPRSSTAAPVLPAVRPWIVVALVIATVLAYAPALSAPFVMDDENAIPESSSIQWHAPAGSAVAGRPVVSATLALNHAVNTMLGVDQRPDPSGPYKAVGYRLLNVLFHLCTGALLFGVLRRTIRGRAFSEDWRGLADPLAGAVCALWLLHPIQSEAINYIVQRTELLASLFYVMVLYASIRAWDASSGQARLRWYGVGVLACAIGMLCKEIVVSAPLAIVLYDRAFRVPSWSALRRPGKGRGWFYVALAAACVVPYVVIAVGARGDTAGLESPMKWYVYFYSQCWAIAHYLRLVVWPNALTVDYGEQAIGGTRGIPGLLLLSMLGIATLVAWTRVPRWGWFAFLGSWFFMLLAPSSSFVPIPTEIAAERRIYLALAGVLVLAVVCVAWLRRRLASSIPARRLSFGFMGVAAVLAVVTAARSHTYSSTEQLWRGVVRTVPDNLRGYVNLGSALFREQPPRYAEAETLFNHAIVRDSTCRSGCAQLAYVLSAQGRLPEAADLLERTVAHAPGNGPLERRLALTLMKLGSFDRAIPHLEHVASSYPTEQHLVVLAVAYLAVQRQQNGIATFQKAVQLYPGNAEILKLGNTLYAVGRSEDAVPHLKELALALAKGWE
ncbi:MAG: tetratricopeptide repeat protein [Gemmatimonadales bacterium]